jgi:hypothetical protein
MLLCASDKNERRLMRLIGHEPFFEEGARQMRHLAGMEDEIQSHIRHSKYCMISVGVNEK